MSGPESTPEGPNPATQSVPGHFVTEELRDDCARFLDQVRSLVDRRLESTREQPRLGPPR